jgi:hypothetical protein
MDFFAGLAASQEDLGSFTVEVMAARVCVEDRVDERKTSALSLHRPEAGEGRDTCGIAITLSAEVGDGCSAGEILD